MKHDSTIRNNSFSSAIRHKMDCIQYFESESPSNPKLDNIETESSVKEKIDGTEMSENLYSNYQSPNDKQLDETKMSENQSDYCISQSALEVNLIDEKDKLNNKT